MILPRSPPAADREDRVRTSPGTHRTVGLKSGAIELVATSARRRAHLELVARVRRGRGEAGPAALRAGAGRARAIMSDLRRRSRSEPASIAPA